MSPALEKGVSQITSGLYSIAIAAVILGVFAVLIGKRLGGKTRRQQKAAAGLVWAIGLVLLGIFVIPKLFGGG